MSGAATERASPSERCALSVGVDILQIARVAEAIERYGERFLTRVFTSAEIDYCAGRVAALAARFAAKEAIGKALGVGMRTLSQEGIGWLEAEIVNDNVGKPLIRLHGSAAARAAQLGLSHWAVSLAHEREYAVAFVVASGEWQAEREDGVQRL
ncbi:MAG: holo-ACP synthase [Thermoflexales bacterium]|nr:holo-ACP synthase [Thermoflexales bacterium]